MKSHEREWLEKRLAEDTERLLANPKPKAPPRVAGERQRAIVSRKVDAKEAARRVKTREPASARTLPLPGTRILTSKDQLALPLSKLGGIETQVGQAMCEAVRPELKSKAASGKSKEPAGHVWWVSERWSKAQQSNPGNDEVIPKPIALTLTGMQLENANGQNRGSMGAMHAYFGREKKRKQAAALLVQAKALHFIGWPMRITLTRIAPNEVDSDNLRGMFKRVRDGICEVLGFRDDKDRDGYLAWVYAQEKGGNRADNKRGIAATHHVRIGIEVLT